MQRVYLLMPSQARPQTLCGQIRFGIRHLMQLNELLAQIDSLKAELDKLRPLKGEVEHRIMQKFRLDWNYHSNAIEGNSLTLGETRAFLLEGLTADGKPLKDHLDIKGHDELISFLQLYIQRNEKLTEAAVREMHKILLKEPYDVDAMTADGRVVRRKVRLGEYKTEPNCVRMNSGEIHTYVQPEDVPAKMDELIQWHRGQEAKGDLHPLLHAALLHYKFVEIHPFDDGNGRMARILMNLILMRSGFPPVVIKLQEREPYIAALRRADAGETEGIVSFVGKCVVEAENLYLRGAKGESIDDADDIDKAVRLLKQELSDLATPVELSKEVQVKILNDKVIPLLVRLDVKLKQFDEFYQANSATISVTHLNQMAETTSAVRNQMPSTLSEMATKGTFWKAVSFRYHWEHFAKGQTGFSTSVGFALIFSSRSYLLKSSLFPEKTLDYKTWLSDDELTAVVSHLAKAVFDDIQKKRPKN